MSKTTTAPKGNVWSRNGFTESEEQEWKDQGFTSCSKAVAWRELGLNAHDAWDWHFDLGLTLEETSDWLREKVDFESVVTWLDYGFDFSNSREWRRERFAAEDASLWDDKEFSASEAADWIKAGVDDPHEAALLADSGQDPSDYEIDEFEELMY